MIFYIYQFILAIFITTSLNDHGILLRNELFDDPKTSNVSFSSLRSSRFVNAESFLPLGYVRDGSVDYTSHLQKGLDKYRMVIFPGFPILINDRGLNVHSNSHIIFSKGSKLIMKPSKNEKYAHIKIHNVQNVTIQNPVLFGDRFSHIGSSGEWGMGIDIKSGKQISILRPQIYDCWGDGIYIGEISQKGPSTDIKIDGANIFNSRRNGISITSGLDIVITNSTMTNSVLCGIDIEPNSNRNIIENIMISGSTTSYNRSGVQIALSRLIGTSQRNVNILVENHVDTGSEIGLSMGGVLTSSKRPGKNLSGQTTFRKIVLKNNAEPIRIRTTLGRMPKVIFSNINITDVTRGSWSFTRLKKRFFDANDVFFY